MNRPQEQENYSTSGLASTRSGRSPTRPRVDIWEALLRKPPLQVRKRSSVSDVTAATSVGTENRVQWIINAIQPGLQAWAEKYLSAELPPLYARLPRPNGFRCCRRVMRSTIYPLLDELVPHLVRH